MEYLIRKATESDLNLLAQMNKELIEDEGSHNPMSVTQLRERMEQWIRGEWEVDMIENDTEVIGYAVYQIRADDFVPHASCIHLRQFFIVRGLRSNGYGTRALRSLIDHSFPRGSKLTIDVLESNPSGHAFWSKVGFKPNYTHMILSNETTSTVND